MFSRHEALGWIFSIIKKIDTERRGDLPKVTQGIRESWPKEAAPEAEPPQRTETIQKVIQPDDHSA